jgi:predicted PurR-regulated permease PerM
MEILWRVFAVIGAGGVIAALAFVSLLIGVLIHGMIILMAGKPIDDFLRKRGKEIYEPGSAK